MVYKINVHLENKKTKYYLQDSYIYTCKDRDLRSGGQIEHSSTRRQDGDFNISMGLITRTRAKRMKESFENLAKSFVEEIHQEQVKKEKRKPNIESEQPKTLIMAQWK